MAAVHPNRYSNFLIEKSGFFAIHIISQNQKDLLGRFKGPDPKEKFSSLKWRRGKTNCPILEECIAYIECKVIANYRPGNHILYVGEVMDAKVFADAKPLSILDYEGMYKGDK
jgi:flavin reductase (DIM6/NTAB) family NADH-FMN oxidoreductase RutF